RSALIHLYFNIIGTIIFLIVIYGIRYTIGITFWGDAMSRTGIANFHTFFNVAVTIILIPFAGLIEKLARNSIKDPNEEKNDLENLLDDRFLKSPAIAIQQANHVVEAMVEACLENFDRSVGMLTTYDVKTADRLRETEGVIDKMEDKLENYLIKISAEELSAKENLYVSEMFHMIKDYERIGDYDVNLSECAEELENNSVEFSEGVNNELYVLGAAVREIIELSAVAYNTLDKTSARQIEPLEETIDAIVEKLKESHVDRLKAGLCNVHSGIVFLEILTNMERIADHCSNIAVHVLNVCGGKGRYDAHEYIKKSHETPDKAYEDNINAYMEKYFSKIENNTVVENGGSSFE
ncbi:MAG: PhoU domain-containing protein, partial [Oscillospiraceae bacterium]